MTPAEFKRKWARFQGKESAAYQSHFDDLCRLLGGPTPLEADPSGEVFCFQKRVIKDAELFALEAPDPRKEEVAEVREVEAVNEQEARRVELRAVGALIELDHRQQQEHIV